METVVFTFGRFNPPTKGHEKLINKVLDVAKDVNGTPMIFVSHSQDKKRNPLPWEEKISYMKKVFPHAADYIVTNPTIRTLAHITDYLLENGVKNVFFVVGSDRFEDFKRSWEKFAKENFESALVVNAGFRDPNSDNVTGMSATKAREAAKENDFKRFLGATGWDLETSKRMFKDVRYHMGLENE